ncbi:hypothetical protein PTSG_08810 [Salpingoeca rosetta]|uniref:Uncharacterized protein n=1 Tax=Salpingoeca rosetta (strain ATCC 50818 / BSB-021) TaxID=946362 RepID=F2UKS0_SALR5|nr:uncharacterized protein PTSG_08810 [Salpingoeca rosetta]EGD77719.1 hypothetical protein PTSG_08810 [Salpingoeca rosetta]|eukprot:XP_004990195.1 hypothetical protein PTSG_08810 [Salpingoeca rosetta]
MATAEQSLHDLAAQGDVLQLSDFLAHYGRLGIDEEDEAGQTPLIIATQQGHLNAVKFLIAQGSDVRAVDSEGRAALHWACAQGFHKIVQVLAKEAPEMATVQDVLGCIPLHLAAQAESSKVIKAIIPVSRDNIDLPDTNGLTPAHWCTSQGRYKHLAALIENGADLMTCDHQGRTVLHWTAMNESDKCCKQIMVFEPNTINVQDETGSTALMLAIQENNVPVIAAQLSSRRCNFSLADTDRRTCVHWATLAGNSSVLQQLLQYGGNASEGDIHGMQPVHMAVQGDVGCLEVLVQLGVDINAIDGEGRTPLFLAAAQGHTAAAEVLLSNGGLVDIQNHDGHTALHMAAHEGHTDMCSRLIKAGARVDVRDTEGNTPLLYACTNTQTEACEVLLKAGATVTTGDVEGRTLVHWAAITGSVAITTLLHSHHADFNVHDKFGRTPLQYAAFHGHVDVIRALLDSGADIHAHDTEGVTALHWACSAGHGPVIELLVERGAKVNAMELGYNRTPLDYVLAVEDSGVREALVDYLRLYGGQTIGELKPWAARMIQQWWRRAQARVLARKDRGANSGEKKEEDTDVDEKTVERGEGEEGKKKAVEVEEAEGKEGEKKEGKVDATDVDAYAKETRDVAGEQNGDDEGNVSNGGQQNTNSDGHGDGGGDGRQQKGHKSAGSDGGDNDPTQQNQSNNDSSSAEVNNSDEDGETATTTSPNHSDNGNLDEKDNSNSSNSSNNSNNSDGNSDSNGNINSDSSSSLLPSRPMSASARRHLEEQDRRKMRAQLEAASESADTAVSRVSLKEQFVHRFNSVAGRCRADATRAQRIRRTTDAAITIQRSFKRYLKRRDLERKMSAWLEAQPTATRKPLPPPSSLSTIRRGSSSGSGENAGGDERMKTTLRRRPQQQPPTQTMREVAALTIQLWWRRYLRKKLAEQKRREREERVRLRPWTPQMMSTYQGLRLNKTYGTRVPRVSSFKPKPAAAPIRPAYMFHLPSSAERSYSFAVSAYYSPSALEHLATLSSERNSASSSHMPSHVTSTHRHSARTTTTTARSMASASASFHR